MHTCRTNIDMTYFLHDNQLYSLTTGQTSPTTEKGEKTKSNPLGDPMVQLKPLQIAIAAGATFVARGYADDLIGLTKIFKAAISHKGFAVVDVLQPCPTFNLHNTRDWYTKHFRKLEAENWDPTDKAKALAIASGWEEGIPMGILYREERPTLEESFPALKDLPLNEQVKKYDVAELLKEFL
jgi:2-oxoglutarate ferredoxin oxidoreductase subunit beta